MSGNHRSHGQSIGKAPLGPLMAELVGKGTCVCKGKGGSVRLADFSVGSLGASGVVGSSIPIATAAALSAEVLGNGRVSLTFFGDGAANQGCLQEAMNLAGAWKLPVVFLCENNQYALSTPAHAVRKDPIVLFRTELSSRGHRAGGGARRPRAGSRRRGRDVPVQRVLRGAAS